MSMIANEGYGITDRQKYRSYESRTDTALCSQLLCLNVRRHDQVGRLVFAVRLA